MSARRPPRRSPRRAAPAARRARSARRALPALAAISAISALGALAAAPLSGCLRGTTFACDTDADCTGAAPGRCEPVGYCSFPDPGCDTGSRFGAHSGPLSGQCVTAPGGDAGTEPPACPASYARLPGAGFNVYRAIATPATWSAQRDACAADGGYLAEPDNTAELATLNMFVGGTRIWIGVTDAASEGQFRTSRDAPATFLPWGTGQPDDEPGTADCVSAGTTYSDDRCVDLRPAVCECEP